MTDFIETSSRCLGGQFAGHGSMSGDKLTATRELHAMMQGRIVSRGDDDYARTRQIWNAAVEKEPALFAVCERPRTCRLRCGVHVSMDSLCRCAAAVMTGRDALYARRDLSSTSA
jgi:hypothetical protein